MGNANFGLLYALRDRSGSIVKIWQRVTSGSAFCDHLLIRKKQLRQLPPAAIAGVLRVMYPNAALTMLFCGVRGASRSRGTFAATARFAPRSETGRRAVARACPS